MLQSTRRYGCLGLFPAGGPITFHGEEFVFSYTVQPDDFDSDGVSISETVFGFYNSTSDAYVPGPTRTSDDYVPDPIPYDGDKDDSIPGYPGLSVQSGHKVDGRPRIDHVEIVSSPASDNTYRTGESIDVDITFDQPVDVVDENIAASLWFGETNGGEGSVWRGAYYQDGSGADTLRFSYPVRPGDYDSNGLHVGAKTSTGFGAGRIKAAGTDVDALHFFAGVNSSQRVDGRVRVDGMEVLSHPASGDTYRAGETFEIAMVFNRAVEVEGNIHLSMRVGSDDPDIGWRAATYRRAQGSDSLIFGYTIRDGDIDTDGITVLGSWVDYDGKRHGIGGSGSIKVTGTDFDITPPEFNGVTNMGDTRSTATQTPRVLAGYDYRSAGEPEQLAWATDPTRNAPTMLDSPPFYRPESPPLATLALLILTQQFPLYARVRTRRGVRPGPVNAGNESR